MTPAAAPRSPGRSDEVDPPASNGEGKRIAGAAVDRNDDVARSHPRPGLDHDQILAARHCIVLAPDQVPRDAGAADRHRRTAPARPEAVTVDRDESSEVVSTAAVRTTGDVGEVKDRGVPHRGSARARVLARAPPVALRQGDRASQDGRDEDGDTHHLLARHPTRSRLPGPGTYARGNRNARSCGLTAI